MSDLHWVSVIVQDKATLHADLYSMYEPCLSMDEALKLIDKCRNQWNVISAWVEVFDEVNKKHVVFHKCYL